MSFNDCYAYTSNYQWYALVEKVTPDYTTTLTASPFRTNTGMAFYTEFNIPGVSSILITYEGDGTLAASLNPIPIRNSNSLTSSNLTVTVPAGYYESNASKTLTDANLIASNIKDGVSIFGVNGSYDGTLFEWVTVFDVTNVGIIPEGSTGYLEFTPFTESIEANSVWRVTYNNTQYTCIAFDGFDMSEGAGLTDGACIGNSTIFNGTIGNDEPFCCQRYPGFGSGGALIMGTAANSGNVNVKIEKQVASSGGGMAYTRTTICPTTTFTLGSDETYSFLSNSGRIVDGAQYIITYDNVEYVCTAEELWGSDRFLGSIQITWNNTSSECIFPFAIEDWNSNNYPVVYALDKNQHTVKIERLELLTNGTTLTTKTITANGTYAASSDSADGYSSVTVNVGSSSNLQAKTNITPTTSSQTITADSGYDGLSSVQINAMPTGSATGPTSLSGSSATVSTGTNTITLTKTGVSTTPTVSAGYVSAATSSSATVALTASVTTKAAATITPSTSNQTISSGTYLTGTQTISGDANLVGSNIISGKSIFGVSGTVVINKYYTGSSAPSSSLGSNGDIYIQT